MVDIIGYIASIFVLISFMMKDIDILRIVSIVGCVFFLIYGYCSDAYPTIVVNIMVIILNLYQLYKKPKVKK